ncbi:acyl-CoA dehydrogenase family protein [Streptomyces sp. GQFP]|uniref:acyl-CoA dehydrogenase family protein n=1 Tax=Streptomyces sp. GQFP TaxID=2907545 RepID=UPI001F1B30EE|nr:acyl-CoA dehydrogenase family protein [Streptomyces sp. GQFP]UIX29371.1 acyl-CoA/acyl-ACP dehydrogenase [Streptomyces sp. GQFP]
MPGPVHVLTGLTDEEQQFAEVAYEIASGFAGRSFGDRAALDAYWDECRRADMCGLGVPEEYGGAGEDLFPLVLATERTSAAGFPATRLLLGQGMCGRILLRAGNEEQRRRWLPRVASGSVRFSFGLTEAEAGSNALKMRTTARRKGDGWVLNGEKTYITAFDECDVMLLVANAPHDGGITLFIVDDPQSKIAAQPVQLGMTIYERHYTLFIDDLQLGPDAVVGEVGKGFRAMFAALNCERLLVGAQALGLGRYGLRRAVGYAKEREVFDAPIGSHQAVQHPLAESYVQLEAAWALLVCAARGYSEGKAGGKLANAAKLACADAGFYALDRALQTFGGSGYTADVGLLEPYLVARLLKSVPVSRELALNQIATEGLGLPRSY